MLGFQFLGTYSLHLSSFSFLSDSLKLPRRVLTPPWSFGFGFLNWNERNFGLSKMKKDEKKFPNERGWHGGWDDTELEKRRDNLSTKNGTGSKCIKIIILFILKDDYHISHCWVLKMLLCWDGKPKAQLSLFLLLLFNLSYEEWLN